MNKDIPLRERLIMALDVATAAEARQWVEKLDGKVFFYKVGLQMFLQDWFNTVDWITSRGCKVFLDLKFFDVPQTVKLTIEQLKHRKVTFASVHGNEAILKAACEAKGGVKILAVTVLTSFDDKDMKDLGFACSPKELVISRAKRGLAAGCDGIICSGLETEALRSEFGDKFLIVNPGIRPVENRPEDDQKRVTDAYGAFARGADYIVMGRPIKTAPDPAAFVDKVFADIERGLKAVGKV